MAARQVQLNAGEHDDTSLFQIKVLVCFMSIGIVVETFLI